MCFVLYVMTVGALLVRVGCPATTARDPSAQYDDCTPMPPPPFFPNPPSEYETMFATQGVKYKIHGNLANEAGDECKHGLLPLIMTAGQVIENPGCFVSVVVPEVTIHATSKMTAWPPSYEDPLCTQAVTSAWWTQGACTLPSRCGFPVKTELDSTWYGSTITLCIGTMFPHPTIITKGDSKVAVPQDGIWHVYELDIKLNSDYDFVDLRAIYNKRFHLLSNGKKSMIVPVFLMDYVVVYDLAGGSTVPKVHEVQGRYCVEKPTPDEYFNHSVCTFDEGFSFMFGSYTFKLEQYSKIAKCLKWPLFIANDQLPTTFQCELLTRKHSSSAVLQTYRLDHELCVGGVSSKWMNDDQGSFTWYASGYYMCPTPLTTTCEALAVSGSWLHQALFAIITGIEDLLLYVVSILEPVLVAVVKLIYNMLDKAGLLPPLYLFAVVAAYTLNIYLASIVAILLWVVLEF